MVKPYNVHNLLMGYIHDDITCSGSGLWNRPIVPCSAAIQIRGIVAHLPNTFLKVFPTPNPTPTFYTSLIHGDPEEHISCPYC